MARGERLARLDERRLELEAEYTVELIAALQATASGKWGLFDHNGDRWTRVAIAPVIDRLGEIGEAIDKARAQLDLQPFELQQQFLAARGKPGPQAVGEPKQARAWLDRLARTGDSAS
ncbi:hypothetical protein E5A73_00320 [Sphingomonas gei]|uniref:Uncharacterized protein n=1 Tax=Sphingomonas gei TaxID=1395960 RepID=A0A4V3QZV3_9SPHN|nr:hypothetical protein [Sphingomonas gei]TGX55622.1 hypothetical protein E5A73_00320 [Sphingomonas gei]